ncbi:MAG: hypothetical protein QM820_20225 [Minicystis sp.]
MRSSTLRTGLFLLSGALGASACTSILGGFDFDGQANTGGSSSSTTSASSGTGGATSSSTSTSTTTSTSSGAMCTTASCSQAADCTMKIATCHAWSCDMGCCVDQLAGDGAPADTSLQTSGDCKQVVCDGNGGTKQIDDLDDTTDDQNPCTKDLCKAGGTEIHSPVSGQCAINGGKVCGVPGGPVEGQCVRCNVNGDCTSPEICINNTCKQPACNDQMKDGTETDVDCGGGACPGCQAGLACGSNSDCASKICTGTTCAMEACNDFVQNGDETDIDCGGGACPLCATGLACVQNSDCAGNKCIGNKCVATCTDGVKNQNETDVDCGGPCATKCGFAKACQDNTDCLSGWCNPMLLSCDAEVLANNQASGQAVAVDAGTVFWVTYGGGSAGTVMKLPLGTNTPIPLAMNEQGPVGIALDVAWPGTAGAVYWTTGGGMVKRKRADNTGPIDVLAMGQSVPGAGLVVDANAAYWANDGDSTIKKVNLTSPFTVTMLTAVGTGASFDQHMAYGSGYVFWSNAKTGTIYKTLIGGGAGAISEVGGQAGVNKPVGVAVDAVNVYWADAQKGTVSKMTLGGGTVIPLASGLAGPWDIAIDTNNVYVLENVNSGRVLEVPINGGTTKVLVPNVYYPRGIAVDASWVYYTAGDNTVRRVHKQ